MIIFQWSRTVSVGMWFGGCVGICLTMLELLRRDLFFRNLFSLVSLSDVALFIGLTFNWLNPRFFVYCLKILTKS